MPDVHLGKGATVGSVIPTDKAIIPAAVGVDIGCGTGCSTIALASYCDHVFGVDPSESMLADAKEHPKVTYIRGSGDDLTCVPTRPVEIVTFAGSLCYAKTKGLRRGLIDLCAPGATVVVYDFEVLLHEALANLEIDIPAVGSDYDHAANFLDWMEHSPRILDTGRVQLELSSEELGHVVLADSLRLEALSEKLETPNLFERVVEMLSDSRDKHELNVDTYFARYQYSPVR